MKPRFFTLVLTLGALALLAGAIALWGGLIRPAPAPRPPGPATTPPSSAPAAPSSAPAAPSRMIGNSALSHGGPASGGVTAPGTLRREDRPAPAAEDQGAGR